MQNALLDEHLLAYLHAYQEYTVLSLELSTAMRDGHIKLAQARRDLSRTSNTSALSFGTTSFPREFEPLLRVESAPGSYGAPVLRLRECEATESRPEGAALTKKATTLRNRRHADAVSGASGPSGDGDMCELEIAALEDEEDGDEAEEGEELAEEQSAAFRKLLLQELGVDAAAADEIAGALGGDGPQALMSGDTLALENERGGGTSCCSLRSKIDFSPSGSMASVKQAQFEGLLHSAEGAAAAKADRKLPERPDPQGDPLRWFSALPPPALRQAQKSFRRSTELSVQLANAVAAMHAAREQYELLAGDTLMVSAE